MNQSIPDKDMLAEPATAVVCNLAIAFLDAAATASARLETHADERALHDFRVALRRLRSTLRAYRGCIKQWVPRRLMRKARALARATNSARDSEVQAGWLRTIAARIRPHERPGYQWLVRILDARVRTAYQDMRASDVPGHFRKFDARLRRSLIRDADKAGNPPFEPVLFQRIHEAGAELETHLQRVRSPADEAEAHQARIAAKRLRYLLEPVTDCLPHGTTAVEELKQLQDLLGEIHDMQVMENVLIHLVQIAVAEQAKQLMELTLDASAGPPLAAARRRSYRTGLLAVGALVREHRQALFAELQRRLIGGGALTAVNAVRRAAGGVSQ